MGDLMNTNSRAHLSADNNIFLVECNIRYSQLELLPMNGSCFTHLFERHNGRGLRQGERELANPQPATPEPS